MGSLYVVCFTNAPAKPLNDAQNRRPRYGGGVNGCSVADYNSGESAGIVSPMMYTWADNEDKD
jgi:hypothetical protein